MSIKHYDNDPAKARSRDLVKGMLERTLLKEKSPADVHVVCFPGIDAQEVLDVYDPLGIPRSNVTGLEIDPYIAGEITSKGLGINVVNQSAEEYFANMDSYKSDVVSLDFTGPINKKSRPLIMNITKKQALPQFLLHLGNSMRRDAYFSELLSEFNLGEGNFSEFMNDATQKITKSNNELNPELLASPSTLPEDETRDIRAFHYSTFIRTSMYYPDVLGKKIGPFLYGAESYKKILTRLQEEYRVSDEELKASGINDEKISRMRGFMVALNRTLLNKLTSKVTGRTRLPPEKCIKFFTLLQMTNQIMEGRSFFPTQCSKYSYISESGTPMNGDVIFLEKNLEMENVFTTLAQSIGYPQGFEIKKYKEFERALGNFLSMPVEFSLAPAEAYIGYRNAERVYLGNSRQLRKEAGTGILGKVLTGCRGLVDKLTSPKETLPSNEEKITKEQVIDMLASGIPAKEIVDAYPCSFTEGQLRAYKAWITMRAKQEEKAEESENVEALQQ